MNRQELNTQESDYSNRQKTQIPVTAPTLHTFHNRNNRQNQEARQTETLQFTHKRQKLLLLVTLLQALFSAPVVSDTIKGRVVAVQDGDSLILLDQEKNQVKIRLGQIDAPETRQDFGKASKKALSGLVYGRTVKVEKITIDNYGRVVGTVWLDGADINRLMLESGMAWAYRKYLHDLSYLETERQARNARLGLWSQPDPEPPWNFRHSKPGQGVHGIQQTTALKKTRISKKQRCGSKQFCNEMDSCSEAQYYLRTCGNHDLDRDADGVACETLCEQ